MAAIIKGDGVISQTAYKNDIKKKLFGPLGPHKFQGCHTNFRAVSQVWILHTFANGQFYLTHVLNKMK